MSLIDDTKLNVADNDLDYKQKNSTENVTAENKNYTAPRKENIKSIRLTWYSCVFFDAESEFEVQQKNRTPLKFPPESETFSK